GMQGVPLDQAGELAYFGLIPSFHGRGLGRFLLDWGIRYAWRELKPSGLWLHTCDLDSPAALKLYFSTGFKKFKQQEETVDLP
ncbi:MAG: GNAT family N-acetyltransferase, partial [bacterium]